MVLTSKASPAAVGEVTHMPAVLHVSSGHLVNGGIREITAARALVTHLRRFRFSPLF